MKEINVQQIDNGYIVTVYSDEGVTVVSREYFQTYTEVDLKAKKVFGIE